MKKRLLSLALCLCMSAVAVTGCKKEDKKEETKTDATSEVIPFEDDTAEGLHKWLMKQNGDDALEYTKLGDYSNLAIDVEKQIEVTDEVFQEELDALLTSYAYNFTGEVVSGQTVNIDYAGSLNGELFEGGSDQAFDLEIGSGTFIEGFEEQLIGMQVGSTKTINVTFPSDYTSETLAGKETQFVVTANAVVAEDGAKSELTDQWVKLYLRMSGGLLTDATVDAFKDYYRSYLEDSAVSLRENNELYAASEKLLALATVSDDVPEAQNKFYTNMVTNSIESNIYSSYKMTLEEYMEAVEMTQEQFDEQIASLAKDRMAYEYAIICVGEKEGLAPTQEEYTATLQSYADSSAITLEEFREQYQESYQMELYFSTYEEKVLKFLLETATITDVTSSAVSAE